MVRKLAIVSVTVGAALGFGSGLAAAEDHPGVDVQNGNVAMQTYGNAVTGGYMSPQLGLIQGTLNDPCIALPVENFQNIVAVVNIGVQDILSDQQNQQCVVDATATHGDAVLSHIPVNGIDVNFPVMVD